MKNSKKTKKRVTKKTKKKIGFTLIELLAVIIILGILMIIAILSVTKYISDSRKNTYIDTAKEVIAGTRNVVNEGKLGMYDTNTTYYIPSACIKTENGGKASSPYGEFTEAYIGVIYDGKGYNYYWISVDDAGQGISNITPLDKLEAKQIESDLKDSDIKNKIETTGIGERTDIKILNCETEEWRPIHLDNTSNNVPEEGSSGSGGNSNTIPSNIVCIPATTLHTATCNRSDSYGCNATGQAGNGNTITYGRIPNPDNQENYTPQAGDAYDCKVTQDGGYTERFYYVGSEGNNSILIYYTNMNDQTLYAYDSSNENWHGPRTGYQYLPSTDEWNNPGLIAPGTRSIAAENGNGSTSGGTIENFTYTGKAARFLTYQEVASATSITSTGNLNSSNFLMENIGQYEGSSGTYGYWLETPRSSSANNAWRVSGNNRNVSGITTYSTSNNGVRPAITVLTSNILN